MNEVLFKLLVITIAKPCTLMKNNAYYLTTWHVENDVNLLMVLHMIEKTKQWIWARQRMRKIVHH